MSFDFSNYTYSGLLTIFSMVMGMAYPTIQAAIQNIDAKYGSAQIVTCFVTEKCYRVFRLSLALSIVFALCSPFVLMLLENNANMHYTWMLFHTLVVLLLLASVIKLYGVILTYGVAGDLVEHLKCRNQKEHINSSSVMAEIASFAASKEQKKVYLSALQSIIEQMTRELRAQSYEVQAKAFDMNNPSTFNSSLSEDMNRAIERLVGILVNKRYNAFFTCDTTIVSTFYNILEQHPISLGIRNIIWRMVSDVVLSGNKEWLVLYWGIADQYVRNMEMNLFAKNDKQKTYNEENLKAIKEFHIAMGGMLIKYGKVSWLHDVMFYTNTQPPTYPLLCNTFVEVVEMFRHFKGRMHYPYVWYLQQNYPVHGVDSGVNTDASLVYYVYQYIVLMFLRLWYLDYNVSYCKAIEVLPIRESVDDNQKYVDILELLLSLVNDAFDRGLNNQIGFKKIKREKAIGFIKKNILLFKEEIEKTIKNPKIDEAKRYTLIESIKAETKKWYDADNATENKRFTAYLIFKRNLRYSIPQEYLLEKYNSNPKELGEHIVGGLKVCFHSILPSFFQMQQSEVDYDIAYEHVGEALRRLNLNKDYVVVSFGFGLYRYFEHREKAFSEAKFRGEMLYFSDAGVYEREGLGEASLVILRLCDVPYADIVENEKESYKLITTDVPVYSNIDSITEQNLGNLLFRIFVNVHYPQNLKFVRIKVPNVFTNNSYDLNKVQAIQSLL